MNKKTGIFIFSHKLIAPEFIRKAEYRYVQCNAVSGHLPDFDFFDDEKNSIYDLNWCFSESTGISRIVYDEYSTRGLDYIGFGQYRRYLEYHDDDLKPNRIICQRFNLKMPVIRQYLACHYADAYSLFMTRLFCLNQKLYQSINKYFNDSTMLYRANCFIMSSKIFDEYRKFVKSIFPVLENIVRDGVVKTDYYDNYQKRYMSFLFERLTSYWIYEQANSGIDVHDESLLDLQIPNTENGTR